jgi:drug/metabolite transporter (DMT)-like permease
LQALASQDRNRAPVAARLRGLAWGLGAVVVWAGSFALTRFGVKTTLSPYDITALRFGFAAVVLSPVLWRKGLALPALGGRGLVALVCGTGAPYALLIALGLRDSPASEAAAIVPGAMAAIAAILGAALLGERVTPRKAVGISTILAGSALIAGLSQGRGGSLSLAAFLLASTLWAVYVVTLRRSRLSALHAAAIVAAGSAAVYLPLYAIVAPAGLGRAPFADSAFQAIYQGGLTTAFGLVAFNRAIDLLGATAAAALPALVPVVTLAIGAALLGERPGVSDVVAACLIGLGVALTVSPSRP